MSTLRWVTRGDEAIVRELSATVQAALDTGSSQGTWIELGERRGYLKLGPLRGKASLRYALRTRFGLVLPRLQEFDNLTWLLSHGFRAPEPLAAGGAFRNGRPVFQYLLTEEVANAPTLRAVFESSGFEPSGFEPSGFESGEREERLAILENLGGTLARLHEHGFVHRDVFPRNLLVEGTADAPRIVFLDAWRGGVKKGLRGPAYDIACLMLFAPELFSEEEQARLLSAYLRESGRPPAPTLRAVVRQRRALAMRHARKGREGPPPLAWTPPGNLGATAS